MEGADQLLEEVLRVPRPLLRRQLGLEPEGEEAALLRVLAAGHRHQEHAELQLEVARPQLSLLLPRRLL